MIYEPELKVMTSRFSNPLLANTPYVKAGIVQWPPRFPLIFELTANLYALAPSAAMMIVAREQGRYAFVERYLEKLDRVGADEVIRLLRCVQGDHEGIVLLCFECLVDGTRWCHRRVFAGWLYRTASIVVEELPDPGKAPRRKTKRPPDDPRQIPFDT